jgi:FtsP/CotA-like multicopper oxidase with cupredoxin domain
MRRRDLVRLLGGGALTGMVGRLPRMDFGRPRAVPVQDFAPDVDLTLTAAPGEVAVLPGAATRVWRFEATLLTGPADSVEAIPGSWLGPVLRFRRGQRVRIRFTNGLSEPTIVHWHGMDVPAEMDGHPSLVIDPGAEYLYEFTVTNRAGTYWYHPHPHMRTGPQVYQGLAGVIVVSDDEESALGLPSGAEEHVWVLQDRRFDGANQLQYLGPGMMDRMMGFLGDRFLVNGAESPTMPVSNRAHRIRLLNGSNARIYKLAWSDDTPMTVIGGDGGLLDVPLRQRYLTLAPAQRAEILLDLSGRAQGSTLDLVTAAYPAAEVGMAMAGMGGRGGGGAANGVARRLLALRVASAAETGPFRLPARLASFGPAWSRPADGPVRRIALDFRQMQWFLDGHTFEMLATTPQEEVLAGSTQVWEVANIGGMMGTPMAHPIHMHGRQFRVLSRSGGQPGTTGSVREGLVDAGWQDTVLVLPGETVRLQVHFTEHPGLYLYHCHILEHEDGGMMRNFRVRPKP